MDYQGNELELFASATNWKAYFGHFMRPFLKGHVLEVGAGKGGTTAILCDGSQKRWLCLEPDGNLARLIQKNVENGSLPGCCSVLAGTLADVGETEKFDSILYIDVLEHIMNDKEEIKKAAIHLNPGGSLIVLVPSCPWLFSPFDESLGHFRRYTRKSLRAAVRPGLEEVLLLNLDSAGLFASAANRLLLRQSMPTSGQVQLWDKKLVPVSRITDRVTGFTAGKSILGIWRKID